MRNFWLVAKNEYLRTVGRRAFLALTLGVPVLVAIMIGAMALIVQMSERDEPIGFVDQAGVVDASLHATLPDANERVQIREFPDLESGRAAVERGEIQALFVFPPGYPASLETELYYQQRPPGNNAWEDLDDLVRASMLASLPAETRERLLEGPQVTVHDLASGRTFDEGRIVDFLLPFAATFLFLFATMSASGYLLSVVSTEKENRTMEVMITTVTPMQLIGGKTLGLLAATLTQLLVYLVTAVLAVLIAARFVPELQGMQVPWTYLGIVALFFLPAYALLAGIMIAIGAAVTELQQGQQVAGLLNLLFVAPLFMMPLFLENPQHPAIVAATLFPTTSFLTVALRWGWGTVPAWQLVAGWVILVASALLAVWAAARVVRVGMLRYGQPMSVKGMVAAVRRGW
jgi:ABC-2 type transport system permease protein